MLSPMFGLSYSLSDCLDQTSDSAIAESKWNKKLRYREEHSASVVLSWCTNFMTFIGRQTTDQQLINHLYETGHETYSFRNP